MDYKVFKNIIELALVAQSTADQLALATQEADQALQKYNHAATQYAQLYEELEETKASARRRIDGYTTVVSENRSMYNEYKWRAIQSGTDRIKAQQDYDAGVREQELWMEKQSAPEHARVETARRRCFKAEQKKNALELELKKFASARAACQSEATSTFGAYEHALLDAKNTLTPDSIQAVFTEASKSQNFRVSLTKQLNKLLETDFNNALWQQALLILNKLKSHNYILHYGLGVKIDGKAYPSGIAKVYKLLESALAAPSISTEEYEQLREEITRAISPKQVKTKGLFGLGARDDNTIELYGAVLNLLENSQLSETEERNQNLIQSK